MIVQPIYFVIGSIQTVSRQLLMLIPKLIKHRKCVCSLIIAKQCLSYAYIHKNKILFMQNSVHGYITKQPMWVSDWLVRVTCAILLKTILHLS